MPSLRLRAAAALAVALAAPVAAQDGGDSTRVETPAPARGWFSYGRSLTFADILAETARLRPVETPPDAVSPSTDPFIGIQGLVVDETATPSGRLFYDAFFLLWTPPPGAERATITLGEQPLPGNGTAIVLRADGEVLLQTRLPRRPDEVEDLARQAVQFVRQRLSGG